MEGAIKNGQSRNTVNIGHTRQKTIQQHNICWTPLYTNNVNKTWVLLQTTGGKRLSVDFRSVRYQKENKFNEKMTEIPVRLCTKFLKCDTTLPCPSIRIP
jgi:hypothetical protein